MSLFKINTETCKRDGICAAVCPVGLIELNNDVPTPVAHAEEFCIRCGHCAAVCPTDSFLHRDMPIEEMPPIPKDTLLSIDQCETFLRRRRSIRAYKNKAVNREDIQRLI
ncbi:MAG: 4Fe-4S binding protein, partial [Desulfobacterales bacterium]|nr:4Fe-4S binding protein [Desulfobacterales bacterium]